MAIHAIFEDGVFKPLGKVDLPEHCRVEVFPLEDEPMDQTVERRWSLHLVKWVADDFDEMPPEFEGIVGR